MAGRRQKAAAEDGPSAWQRLAERLSLPRLEAWSNTLRTVFLNALFLIAVIIIVPVLIGQFSRDQVVIEPISVPDTLSEQGLTPDVVASRVWDGLKDVVVQSETSKDSIVAIPDARRVEFSFPDSGLSVESLIFHVRRLFNVYETRIGGEFVCGTTDCARDGLKLRLRVIRDRVEIIDLPNMGTRPERDYFADAASRVLAVLDPFVAIAAAAEKEPVKATTLARRLIRSHHKDAKWAHNLVGLIRRNGGDTASAIADFRAAIEIDPGFLPARANLGHTLIQTGDLAGAKTEFEEIRHRAPRDVRAAEGFAELASAQGDADAAVARFKEAADLDPLNPRYLALAGKIELDRGKKDEGVTLLSRALELDPGYLPAFASLAAMHLAASDFTAAEKIYRDAADYAPDDADAQASHGRMLAILKRWDEAIERYGRATALAPQDAAYWLELARCLQRVTRHDDALAMLEKAKALAPANADIYMSMGDSYRDTGRKEEAVAAYRKFLELDTGQSPMRPVAERFIELLSG